MKLMTIEQFRIRVKEFLNEVTLAEWVMDGIDEVCDKAEKYDQAIIEFEQHLADLKTIKENHGWPFLDREIDSYTIILNRLKGDDDNGV